jgi:hypothetical protein
MFVGTHRATVEFVILDVFRLDELGRARPRQEIPFGLRLFRALT